VDVVRRTRNGWPWLTVAAATAMHGTPDLRFRGHGQALAETRKSCGRRWARAVKAGEAAFSVVLGTPIC